ncbi:MAG: hypothetical protein M0002_18060 [Rhodospirillales bacterium]|nr:hypothetical protein [Rhodospirillales bacterium]
MEKAMPCCKENDQKKPASEGAEEHGTPEGSPMAMGMAMAKKMMGQGGNPME